jgi:opacity protein-like surface antigen
MIRKTITALSVAAVLAVPAAALADAPDGTYTIAPKANEHASSIGMQSSQINQNGQFVSGHNKVGVDQTTYPGSRADIVQEALGH